MNAPTVRIALILACRAFQQLEFNLRQPNWRTFEVRACDLTDAYWHLASRLQLAAAKRLRGAIRQPQKEVTQ